MRKWLKEFLVCPECLPDDRPLSLTVKAEQNDDVIAGHLDCPACDRRYPINRGVAIVLPDRSKAVLSGKEGYNSTGMLSAYLWSHFCDCLDDPAATEAYNVWSSYFRETEGCALDIGCAVGRLSFEMSNTHKRVVGIDTSLSFIEKARDILNEKQLRFDLVVEGHITEKRFCRLDDRWCFDRVEFIVADATALPFAGRCFATVSSVNILEKIPYPLQHLTDVNRVLRADESLFLFSDPFSWDESTAGCDQWLSGVTEGKYKGRGIDNVRKLLLGEDGVFAPPFEIVDQRDVAWKIRKTENLWEHITSKLIVGTRGPFRAGEVVR